MAKFPVPDPNDLPQLANTIVSMHPPLNLFRTIGHSNTMVGPVLQLGAAVLTKTKMDPVMRELAIVRAAVLARSDYVLNQHDEIARVVGATQEQLDALRPTPIDEGPFYKQVRAVLAFTEECLNDAKVSDETFDSVSFLNRSEIIEVMVSVGFYSMISRISETLELDIETGPNAPFVAHTLAKQMAERRSALQEEAHHRG